MKQHGAMLAKGRLLGIQFETLFTDELYTRITCEAVTRAIRIKEAFREKGCEFLIDSSTNQQFPILKRAHIEKLSEKFAFMVWPDHGEDKLPTRFCTSWATSDAAVDALIQEIKQL